MSGLMCSFGAANGLRQAYFLVYTIDRKHYE